MSTAAQASFYLQFQSWEISMKVVTFPCKHVSRLEFLLLNCVENLAPRTGATPHASCTPRVTGPGGKDLTFLNEHEKIQSFNELIAPAREGGWEGHTDGRVTNYDDRNPVKSFLGDQLRVQFSPFSQPKGLGRGSDLKQHVTIYVSLTGLNF